MPYARVDNDNRIIEWGYTKGIGYNAEFSNGEYIDENCVDGLEDFVIIDGEAVYSPTVEKQTNALKSDFDYSDYVSSKFVDLLLECDTTDDILSCIKSYREEYAEELKQRKQYRVKMNELKESN